MTLYNFVNILSLRQQRTIRHLKYNADLGSMIHPKLHFNKSYRDFALRAAQVPSIIEKLQDLRTLDIDTRVPTNAEDVASYAHSIHQLLRFVRVSEKVTVNLDLCHEHTRFYKKMQWGGMSQEQFAITVWKLIHDPHAHIQSAVGQPGQ